MAGCKASLVAQMVKNPHAVQKTQVPSLGRDDPLEKGVTTHSSQYSCLENPVDSGAWWAIVHWDAESNTSDRLTTFTLEKQLRRADSAFFCIFVCRWPLLFFPN